MILKCDCKNEQQDKIYGKGRRVHNEATQGKFRCTVCGNTKNK